MASEARLSRRAIELILVALAVIGAGFALTPPIPQDPGYHLFADSRTIAGIPNAWNVLSNIPFLLVGLLGLLYVGRHRGSIPGLAAAYAIFFAGIALTAFGSGYYHLAPHNASLVFDRLPMTIGFAGLFALVIGEFVSLPAGRRILLPLLLIGTGSVIYWAATESRGVGDLRPYAVVQFLPMLLTPIILIIYRAERRLAGYFWLLLLFYGLAKIAEFLDAEVFAVARAFSGHSLKHILAALSPAVLLLALDSRRRLP